MNKEEKEEDGETKRQKEKPPNPSEDNGGGGNRERKSRDLLGGGEQWSSGWRWHRHTKRDKHAIELEPRSTGASVGNRGSFIGTC